MEKQNNKTGFYIVTNVDGCVTGNYYAEAFNTLEEAEKFLKIVKQGDGKAFISKITPVME